MNLSVIIAAAGAGKRLYSESLEVPKPLLFYKTKPIIAHIIDLYLKVSQNIIVVVSSNDQGMFLKAWLIDFYKNPIWLKIIVQPIPSGTNDAVQRALEYVNDKLLVSWADFIFDEDDFLNKIQTNETTFFTSDIQCRFGLVDNKVKEQQSNPGFIGLYLFDKKPILIKQCEDFIENFIDTEIKTNTVKVTNLGTITDLIKNKAFEKQSTRFFNEVKITKNKVYKTPINEQGKLLQEREIHWYKNCPKELRKYLPKIEITDKIILEKIQGKIISECELDKNFWRKKLPKLLNKLHQGDCVVNEDCCISTYIDKPKQRLKEVENTINQWFSDSKKINGIDYSDWKFPIIPKDLIPEKFTFVHGDLQFSNSFLDTNGHIKIFDPRGYFGNTLLYGDPAYDIAKILYATDAYHKINESKFSVNKLNNKDTIFIHNPSFKLNDDMIWFFNWSCDKYHISKEKLNFLLFGIWLSLTSYIINDPIAIIGAYCKSMVRSKDPLYA